MFGVIEELQEIEINIKLKKKRKPRPKSQTKIKIFSLSVKQKCTPSEKRTIKVKASLLIPGEKVSQDLVIDKILVWKSGILWNTSDQSKISIHIYF